MVGVFGCGLWLWLVFVVVVVVVVVEGEGRCGVKVLKTTVVVMVVVKVVKQVVKEAIAKVLLSLEVSGDEGWLKVVEAICVVAIDGGCCCGVCRDCCVGDFGDEVKIGGEFGCQGCGDGTVKVVKHTLVTQWQWLWWCLKWRCQRAHYCGC